MARIRQLGLNGGLHCQKSGSVWVIHDGEAARFLRERHPRVGGESADPEEQCDP
jgi:hypothetical protein